MSNDKKSMDPKFKAKILEEIAELSEDDMDILPDHVQRLIDRMLLSKQQLDRLMVNEQQLNKAYQQSMLDRQNQEVALGLVRDLVVEEYLLAQGAEVHVIRGGGGSERPVKPREEEARAAGPADESNGS